jgi:cytochrome c-type biogenesis protein CcmE
MALVAVLVLGIGTAVGLGLIAFQENLRLFIDPSEVVAGKAPKDRIFRLGGMVKEGSLHTEGDGLTRRFEVTDFAESVPVVYTGILPDLFREGQGIVANGKLRADGVFVAEEVLAKHDENYMPPEVAESLKNQEGAPQNFQEAHPGTTQ